MPQRNLPVASSLANRNKRQPAHVAPQARARAALIKRFERDVDFMHENWRECVSGVRQFIGPDGQPEFERIDPREISARMRALTIVLERILPEQREIVDLSKDKLIDQKTPVTIILGSKIDRGSVHLRDASKPIDITPGPQPALEPPEKRSEDAA